MVMVRLTSRSFLGSASCCGELLKPGRLRGNGCNNLKREALDERSMNLNKNFVADTFGMQWAPARFLLSVKSRAIFPEASRCCRKIIVYNEWNSHAAKRDFLSYHCLYNYILVSTIQHSLCTVLVTSLVKSIFLSRSSCRWWGRSMKVKAASDIEWRICTVPSCGCKTMANHGWIWVVDGGCILLLFDTLPGNALGGQSRMFVSWTSPSLVLFF